MITLKDDKIIPSLKIRNFVLNLVHEDIILLIPFDWRVYVDAKIWNQIIIQSDLSTPIDHFIYDKLNK